MRVFEIYKFDYQTNIEISHIKDYIDKMLDELGLGYKYTAIQIFPNDRYQRDFSRVISAFPVLEKYLQYNDVNPKLGEPFFSSFTDDWDKGELYAAPEDAYAAVSAFWRIEEVMKISKSVLMLEGVDWYGGGDTSPITVPRTKYNQWIRPKAPETACPGIKIVNRAFNTDIFVTVEAAVNDEELQNTNDVIEKLKPFLGDPKYMIRKCMFSYEEHEKMIFLEKKYREKLETLFDEMVGECRADDPYEIKNGRKVYLYAAPIKGLCDKRSVNNAFKGTGMQVTESKTGNHFIRFADKHNYNIEFMFFRKSGGTEFSFCMNIKSFNFSLPSAVVWQKSFKVSDKAQGDEKLAHIAKYCVKIRDDITEELAADFGNCPDWFWKEN